jgi:hypothetical protein
MKVTSNQPNPTTTALRRYNVAFVITMAGYLALLFGGIYLVKAGYAVGPWRYLAILVPVVPVVLLFVAMLRLYGAIDELQRRITLESLAVAGGITALLAVTYGFLESAGLPHPSAWWTWCIIMFSWGIARPIVARQYR